jgi:hypothetical protein
MKKLMLHTYGYQNNEVQTCYKISLILGAAAKVALIVKYVYLLLLTFLVCVCVCLL